MNGPGTLLAVAEFLLTPPPTDFWEKIRVNMNPMFCASYYDMMYNDATKS